MLFSLGSFLKGIIFLDIGQHKSTNDECKAQKKSADK
jgi:hypothetical protein